MVPTACSENVLSGPGHGASRAFAVVLKAKAL